MSHGVAEHPHAATSRVHWLRLAIARFARGLPAFLCALLTLRAVEWWLGLPVGVGAAAALRILALALLHDAVAVLRLLPLLFLLTLPVLRLDGRKRVVAVGVLWSLLLLMLMGLAQYFLVARVPLGADLFGYSPAELRQTVAASGDIAAATLLAWSLPLVVLWALLWRLPRRELTNPGGRWAFIALLFALVANVFAPLLEQWPRHQQEDARNLARNKAAFFVDALIDWMLPDPAPQTGADAGHEFRYLDPRYPFLREERTPDVLGPHFSTPARPPNLVFVVIEGLGRSFSGPGARLGSFTPFLDELATRSISFDNAIAPQGRTFGVLPSLLGSLPFGQEGFAALSPLPAHHTLPSLLNAQGYRILLHGGFNLAFDHTGPFLAAQGADLRVGLAQFGPGYPRLTDEESWGYADAEVYRRTLVDLRAQRQPFVSVIQTMSTHTPYRVPGQDALVAAFEQRLDSLRIPEARRATYRSQRDIYTSILYADRALRDFFTAFAREPAYADTIFVITGDHRLPEIPMQTRLERYHVPLLIFSPRLLRPQRVRAVSSHFDVAPSLLAFLSHHHGIRTPQEVTWLGSGLDLAPVFRNRHDIPIQQTKILLDDYVSGRWYYSQQRLYAIGPDMNIEPVQDRAAELQLKRRLAHFKQANRQLVRDGALLPDPAPPLLPWDDARRDAPPSDAVSGAAVVTTAVRMPAHAGTGGLVIEVDFVNAGTREAPPFVPLAVLIDEQGRERSESYGRAVTLAAGGRATVLLPVKSLLPPGRYFVSVLPSHPDTGRRVGEGRYRLPVELRALSSAPPPTSEPP